MLKKKISLLISFCLMLEYSFAQLNSSNEESGDLMRSNGKIFVVMAVTLVIILGLFLYLLNLDRKIKRLEKSETDQT